MSDYAELLIDSFIETRVGDNSGKMNALHRLSQDDTPEGRNAADKLRGIAGTKSSDIGLNSEAGLHPGHDIVTRHGYKYQGVDRQGVRGAYKNTLVHMYSNGAHNLSLYTNVYNNVDGTSTKTDGGWDHVDRNSRKSKSGATISGLDKHLTKVHKPSVKESHMTVPNTSRSASEHLQDLHRRLGSALPELHALATSTITEERAALAMLFHELSIAHCDIGNVLSYSNQVSESVMESLAHHYLGEISQMMAALDPYRQPSYSVGRGPYQIGGPLHDSRVGEVI